MTKFLNISTDNTLGGNAPSDALVVSQKAIKEYVDNQAGGGGYHPDLFTWQWADHELNDVQWLRADTFSWQSGAVYQAAYQHLVDDIPTVPTITLEDGDVYVRYANGDVAGAHHPYCWKIGNYAAYTNSETPSIGDWTFANATSYLENARITATGTGMPSPETETIAGTTISYYVAADGHKIVLADQESKVAAIYAATGVAWYYILDTANQRFKLPRSSHNKYTTSLSVVGTGRTLGLTSNGSNMYALGGLGTAGLGGYFQTFSNNTTPGSTSGAATRDTGALGVSKDPTYSGLTTTSIEQETDQYKYLYFYVGNFTQTALENTAGLNAELFNGKVDTGHQVIAFQAPNAENGYTWYRKYADGWVEQGILFHNRGNSSTWTFPIPMTADSYDSQITNVSGSGPRFAFVRGRYATYLTYNAADDSSENNDGTYTIRVCGKAAN